MNILNTFVLFVILLKCVAASEDAFGVAFRKAVDGDDFGWLWENERRWRERKDLLNYVIAKGISVVIWFIQNTDANGGLLAALFDNGEKGMIDAVLEKVGCHDVNLRALTDYRPELAGSPDKFFNVLEKIKDLYRQEEAVGRGVGNLFEAGKHDSIVSLVKALGERAFKNDRLKEVAIQKAFEEGSERGNQDLVESYCEHSAIDSVRYADVLLASWKNGKPGQVFQFLLKQADQGDLEVAKKRYPYTWGEQLRLAIDQALEIAPPTGSRIMSIEKVQLVLDVFISITGASNERGPGSIIREYLTGEQGKTKKPESEVQASAGQ